MSPHNFSVAPGVALPRSQFKMPHGHKFTMDFDKLYPFFYAEALPGDTWNVKASALGRLTTPIYPIMDNMRVDVHFFAVPKRLLWENWEKFNGAQDNPGDSTDFSTPKVTTPAGGFAENELYDYFGFPTQVAGISNPTNFCGRAYNEIYNQYYRDQNIINSITRDNGDGPDTASNYVLRKRGKRHDYFTTCLPAPQKGPAATIPLGTDAPVTGLGKQNANDPTYVNQTAYETDASTGVNYAKAGLTHNSSDALYYEMDPNNSGYPNIRVDLSSASSATVEQLRNAFTVQQIYEKDQRSGTRYVEIIRSHFGVVSPDARMQRPEFLGGGKTYVGLQEVPQTSETNASVTPQGHVSAFGKTGFKDIGFVKSFTEHCVIVGLISATADLTYQQGLNRFFTKDSRLDYYLPSMAHLGEQAVTNLEIYAQGDSNDDNVFGYQERWAEYRYMPSRVSGKYRSNATGTLHAYHLSENFGALPTLNQTFIECNTPMDRVLAVSGEPDLYMDTFFNIIASRPIPIHSVPGLTRL
mgnify:CR=1 FL=1